MTVESNSRSLPLERSFAQERIVRLQQAGAILASHLGNGEPLLLDVDGVLLKSDALIAPVLMAENIIPAVKRLESLAAVSVATVRGMHVVEYFRNIHGLQLLGPSILEGGQALLKADGLVDYLVPLSHRTFLASLRHRLAKHPAYGASWKDIRKGAVFYRGSDQWQGQCRGSWYFDANCGIEKGVEIVSLIEPTIRKTAQANGLDLADITVSVSKMRMTSGDFLGIIGISGKRNGMEVDKATAAGQIDGPLVFAADGYGDKHLAYIAKKRGGFVIGIEGNLDISHEPVEFLEDADCVLSSAEELTFVINYAAMHLDG